LIAAFDQVGTGDQQSLDDYIARNWRAGRFAGPDDQRALVEARTLLAAYKALRQSETLQVLGSEVFCQTRPRVVEPDHAIVLSGRIDRVARRPDDAIELLDFKTGAHLPTHNELYNDPATTIYHLLAAERYSALRIVVAHISLRTGSRVEIELDAAGVAAGKERLRELVRQLAADDSRSPRPLPAPSAQRASRARRSYLRITSKGGSKHDRGDRATARHEGTARRVGCGRGRGAGRATGRLPDMRVLQVELQRDLGGVAEGDRETARHEGTARPSRTTTRSPCMGQQGDCPA